MTDTPGAAMATARMVARAARVNFMVKRVWFLVGWELGVVVWIDVWIDEKAELMVQENVGMTIAFIPF